MQTQLTLQGFDYLFSTSADWHPIPWKLARLQEYFLGYMVNGREIYARRSYIAKRLQMSVRTLARYLKWLVDTGWMATIRRTSHTAYRQVLQGPVPSPVPSQAPVSLLTEVPPEAQSKQHHSESSCVSTGDDVACVLSQRPIVTNPDSRPLQEAVKRVGLAKVLHAIWLGCSRKMCSMGNSGTHNKISSANYFLPIVEELEQTELSPGYCEHTRAWVQRFERLNSDPITGKPFPWAKTA